MTVYYTTDADGDRITTGSSAETPIISRAPDEAAALAAMRAEYAKHGYWEVIGIQPGRFGDYWVQTHSEPSGGLLDELTEEAGELYVQAPGQHPGGRAWWITPRADVLVPVLREIESAKETTR